MFESILVIGHQKVTLVIGCGLQGFDTTGYKVTATCALNHHPARASRHNRRLPAHTGHSSDPIFDAKTGHALKFLRVVGDNHQSARPRVACDHLVVRTDLRAGFF